MPFVRSSSGFATHGLSLPTVGRDVVTGRFTKLSEDVRHKIRAAAADGINEWTNDVAMLSLVEVPKGPHEHSGEPDDLALAQSIRYPGNDRAMAANAELLDAAVSYNTVYAAAQHEGQMTYEKDGEEIYWKVESYTTPGTKDHYLEDPLKAMAPLLEGYVGRHVREVLQ